jgi:hypothetical protein
MQTSSISRIGWCNGRMYTSGPNRIRLVRCAAAAASNTDWFGASHGSECWSCAMWYA